MTEARHRRLRRKDAGPRFQGGVPPPGLSQSSVACFLIVLGSAPRPVCEGTVYHKIWGVTYFLKPPGGPGGLSGDLRSIGSHKKGPSFPTEQPSQKIRARPGPWKVLSWEDSTGSPMIHRASPTCAASLTVIVRTLGSQSCLLSLKSPVHFFKNVMESLGAEQDTRCKHRPCRRYASAEETVSH